jgi:hypothetical protein
MRVIRSAGQNVSPSDDGRLYDQIFTDGLFEDTTITNLGANNIALGTLYGVISGRDFTAEAQTIAAVLPEGDTEETGYIYVEIDTSSDDVITINSALAPFTPTYEDINTNGAVVQMILAEYTASAVAVTSITPTYSKASAGTVLPGSVATVEQSQAVSNHSVGEYILLGGQFYRVTRAISAGETITPGSNVSATSAGAELNQLNNDLMPVDISNEFSQSADTFTAYKSGHIIHLYAKFPSATYMDGYLITSIPYKYRPKTNVICGVYSYTTANPINASAWMQANNSDIRLFTASSFTSDFVFSAQWMI